MKRLLSTLAVAVLLCPASAFADPEFPKRAPIVLRAPEFDGKAVGTVAVLVLGAALVLTDVRRRRTSVQH